MIFWLLMTVLVGVCVLALVYAGRSHVSCDVLDEEPNKLHYYAQKLALQKNLENGQISEKAYTIAETELARHFIQSNQSQNISSPLTRGGQKIILLAAALFIPLMCFTFYLQLGAPQLKDQPLLARQNKPIKDQSIEQLVALAEARVTKNPNDIQGWKVLAPIYRRLGRIDDAAYAYRNIMAADPKSVEAATELGEISFIEAGRIVDTQAKQLFEKASQLDKTSIKPKFYLALADFQQGDKKTALEKFNHILKISPDDAPWRPVVLEYIAAIENEASGQTAKAIENNEQIAAMVEGLAKRLVDEPNNIEGWLRLIRSYKVLNNETAYKKAIRDAKKQFDTDDAALTKIVELIKILEK